MCLITYSEIHNALLCSDKMLMKTYLFFISSGHPPVNRDFMSASVTSCINLFHQVLVVSHYYNVDILLILGTLFQAPVMMTAVYRHSIVYFVRT